MTLVSMNPLSPDRMTAAERLDELAATLAAGLIRLKARQSRQVSGHRGESSLDFTANQSGHEPANDAAGERE
jgi:hypothetical protein